jgi:hypothetical protein
MADELEKALKEAEGTLHGGKPISVKLARKLATAIAKAWTAAYPPGLVPAESRAMLVHHARVERVHRGLERAAAAGAFATTRSGRLFAAGGAPPANPRAPRPPVASRVGRSASSPRFDPTVAAGGAPAGSASAASPAASA